MENRHKKKNPIYSLTSHAAIDFIHLYVASIHGTKILVKMPLFSSCTKVYIIGLIDSCNGTGGIPINTAFQ